MKHILVTNDDGITAPGLLALVNEIRSIADVSVLAPDHNWSASGHVKTMHRPIRVREFNLLDNIPAFTSDGAPSDCVAIARLGFFDHPIDLVLSGINPNANIGHDVTYSGTVTAAMEAVIAGIPGIAVSLDSPENHLGIVDYSAAAKIARNVANKLINDGFPTDTVINLNIPYLNFDRINGYRITRQGQRLYREELVKREDPRNQPYYWIGGETPGGIEEEGTDYGAIKAGFVSITPLQLDLTAYRAMEDLSKYDWDNCGKGRNL